MKKIASIIILLFSYFYFSSHTEASTTSQLIIINKKTNTLAFYDGGTLVRTFRVATGRVSTYTPEGTFKIVNKIKNRPYFKKNIPGGDPRNPLGNRWMGLEARGTYGTTYGIHGNNNESSIGRYASSGCVRMHNAEVRWLFDRVTVNTTVIILRSGSSFDAIAKANGYQVSVSVNGSVSSDGGTYIPNGWVNAGNKKYYYQNGTAKKGWQTLAGKRYFFDNSGVMITGWLARDGKKYFFESNGVMTTSWVTVNGNKYYFDPDGVMKIGWLESGGSKYFLNKDGVMQKGWLEENRRRFYFDLNGVMKKDWIEDNGKWYFLDQTGIMKTGWINDGGKWYYINSNGIMNTDLAIPVDTQDDTTDSSDLNITINKYLPFHPSERITSWIRYEDNWYYLYVSKEMAENSILDEHAGSS